MLPIGLKLDQLLEAGEEIFRDTENVNTNSGARSPADVLSLARRLAELVLYSALRVSFVQNLWQGNNERNPRCLPPCTQCCLPCLVLLEQGRMQEPLMGPFLITR